ncbi:MAG: hypothetical protein CMG60_09090 [Candidatus Marinimicrobia bacterium]|nr:hypothetical protein [Candidatus Neomarinimicrobiota bacterium]
MQFEKTPDGFFVYIEKDERIMEKITQFCIANHISNAQLSGIGAVKEIEIGAFDVHTKDYIRKNFNSVMELVSYQGNITIKDDQPFVHAHVTLADHEMNTKGGHLFEATVAAVGEFFIRTIPSSVARKLNHDVGLPCIIMSGNFE